MSSEMRDMLVDVLDAIDHPDGLSLATYNKARALIARTEAALDGYYEVWMYRHAKRGGPWSLFMDERLRSNTERDPTWEVRAFYTEKSDGDQS